MFDGPSGPHQGGNSLLRLGLLQNSFFKFLHNSKKKDSSLFLLLLFICLFPLSGKRATLGSFAGQRPQRPDITGTRYLLCWPSFHFISTVKLYVCLCVGIQSKFVCFRRNVSLHDRVHIAKTCRWCWLTLNYHLLSFWLDSCFTWWGLSCTVGCSPPGRT